MKKTLLYIFLDKYDFCGIVSGIRFHTSSIFRLKNGEEQSASALFCFAMSNNMTNLVNKDKTV